MITVRPSGERGRTRTDWLDSRHTFSFNRYFDPRHMGFRSLRVINEDYVAPGMGFERHQHRDVEILTYVIEGTLEHQDSLNNGSVIKPGELQRMSAGRGIEHSEWNASQTGEVHLLQIWILPEQVGLDPGYEQQTLPADEGRNALRPIASPPGGPGIVTIHQDANVYDACLDPDRALVHRIGDCRHAWLQLINGTLTLNGLAMIAGDGASVSDESELNITAAGASTFLLFDLN